MALTAFDQRLNQMNLSMKNDASATMYNSKDQLNLQWGSPSQLNNLNAANALEQKSREETADLNTRERETRVIPSRQLSPSRKDTDIPH